MIDDDVQAVLPELRAAAESLHRDTFTVYRPAGLGPDPDESSREIPVFTTVHAGIRGKLKASGADNRDVQTPGVKVAETGLEWHTSLSVLGILTDDEVECTAVDPVMGDPALVGTRVRITGPFIKSIATARRFRVVELT